MHVTISGINYHEARNKRKVGFHFVDPDPVGSVLFGWIRIRIVTENTIRNGFG